MEQLQHFSHEYLLSLVQLQPDHNNEISGKEDEDENEDEDEGDFLVEQLPRTLGKCDMCEEEIYSFHLCYYSCKDCDYSLHTFCAQQPTTQQNHPLHPGHSHTLSLGFQDPDFYLATTQQNHPLHPGQQPTTQQNHPLHLGRSLTLSLGFQDPDFYLGTRWECNICGAFRTNFYHYRCSICRFNMDIVCASMTEQKIDHPSHSHQLQRHFRYMISCCSACGDKHSGSFYHCTTCSCFMVHLNYALLLAKLLIHQSTEGNFSHPHLLALTYSFPPIEMKAKFFPHCRVCDKHIFSSVWHYRCDKCRYYVHVDCATLTKEAFMASIFMPASRKTYQNFKDDDHPNLIRCPFPNESVNLLIHLFINKGELVLKGMINGEMFSHPHPLILVDTLQDGSISLHDPMKRVELLCDGCVRPITDMPFYMCSQHQCNFVLHEWCTRLPFQIQDHYDHPEYTLVLLLDISTKFFGAFICNICGLPSNGFAYGYMQCEYFVDINYAFIPDVITHEAHTNHLLLRCKPSAYESERVCRACKCFMEEQFGFHCPSCDFNMHMGCALLLPRSITHKCDKHPLSLRYYPVENHRSEYFCEICEDEFDPTRWFYHCSMCASSMHTAYASIKLQYQQSTFSKYINPIFLFSNVKFGRRCMLRDHPHLVTFVQGISADGQCIVYK